MSGFTFGGAGGAGTSNIFGGGAASNTPKSSAGGGGLFGSTTATSGASSAPLFGGGAATSGTSAFGAQKPAGTGIFGGAGAASSQEAAKPAGGIFGQSTGNAPTPSFSFGNTGASATPPASTTGGIFGNGPSTTPFGGGSTGINFGQPKPAGAAPTPGQENKPATPTTNVFGGMNKPATGAAGGLFGTPGTGAPAASSLVSTTPAPAKQPFSFASTTPAGPPPTNNAPAASTGLFGNSQSQPAGGLFGTPKASAPTQPSQTPATTAPTGGLFSNTPAAAPASNLFNSGAAKAPALGGGIFGAKPSTPATNSTPAATSTEAPKPAAAFSFPSATPAASTPGTQASSTPAAAPASTLFSKPTTTTASTPASSAPAQTPSLFGNPTSTSTATPATTAPSLFGTGALGGKTSTPTTSGAAVPATTTAPAGSNLQQQAGSGAAAATSSGSAPAAPLGVSTAGPSPQLSRLKNKTMDEIITRWASDLSKYQKEFQEQAAKVAQWDRLLIENGDKIQKLYNKTFEAQRAGNEVERHLTMVENQQDELAAWLDRYEADVDEMFKAQIGDSLQGPDQEREKTYKMAEKLSDRLDEMGKDLTHMIDAMNEASATLNKSNKSDDPLSHIVRVLNSHLMQLQWIDQNAKTLQEKVEAAQKLGQSMSQNGFGGPDSDAADHFYRSFMGRR